MTNTHDTCDGSTSTASQTFTKIHPMCPECGSALVLLHGEIVVSGHDGTVLACPYTLPARAVGGAEQPRIEWSVSKLAESSKCRNRLEIRQWYRYRFQRFWGNDGDRIIEYADGSEERYRHGEATAAVEDDGNLDDLNPRTA